MPGLKQLTFKILSPLNDTRDSAVSVAICFFLNNDPSIKIILQMTEDVLKEKVLILVSRVARNGIVQSVINLKVLTGNLDEASRSINRELKNAF